MSIGASLGCCAGFFSLPGFRVGPLPEQVAWHDFDVATGCEKLCDQTPAAAVMVNDQVIAGGDTAGDRIDHVVDELDRKPMLAQGSASGRSRHVGTNPIPPACGIPQD